MTNPFALDTPPAPTPAPMPAPATAPSPAPATPAPASVPAGDDPFDNPAPQEPKGPRMRDLYGRLLLLIPHLVETVPNKQRPGETQQRMTADVVVLDGGPIAYGGAPEKVGGAPHDKTATVPYKRPRMFVSSVGVISQCREALAKKITQGRPGIVLGRLTVGEAKPDQSPPYLLTPATDADKALARQYLSQIDPFA